MSESLKQHLEALVKEAAKRDMPPFTEQNRPESVKKIFRALERDHPDMPAEMKARIAGRQGKKGHQKQGPPYKGKIVSKYKEKKASLSTALDILWATDPAPLEKTAAAYFYDIRKPVIDQELLGSQFCKLATAFGRDPWSLADEVEANINTYAALLKTASDSKVLELAQFYNDWADSTIEKAALNPLKLISGAAKAVTKAAPKAAPKPGVGAYLPRTRNIAGARGGAKVPGRSGGGGVSVESGQAAKAHAAPVQSGGAKWSPAAKKPVPGAKKPMSSGAKKAIGATAIGVPMAGGAYAVNELNQPRRGQF